ncbi:hypothetical protein KR100_13855 [Synechococcus sp. KORDI-100]|nr:hypothetical protein KR100_13855 [Synechococcus sp. KORDI-100]
MRGRLLRKAISPIPLYRADHDDQPVSTGCEGWLVNADQHKMVQFKPDVPTTHAEWVVLRTFHWRPQVYQIPQTRRRMLRHNPIDTSETMAVQPCLICKRKIVRKGFARFLIHAHFAYKFF